LSLKSETRDAVENESAYIQLYEELGEKYPETQHAHSEKFPGSRYWTVMRELEPFYCRSKHLLDFGSNDGVYSIPYCVKGGSALGIDISESLVRKASLIARSLNLNCKFLRGEIDSSSLCDNVDDRFDTALFSEVLEHLQNPDQAIRNIHSLLVSGGHMLITTPTPLFNDSNFTTEYVFNLISGRKLMEHYELDTNKLKIFNVSSFVYRHDGYYPRALLTYVEKFGFKCVKSYTIDYLRAIEKSVETISLGDQTNFMSSPPSPKTRIVKTLRELGLEIEIPFRKLPILNLMGSTNVALFKKS